MSWCRRRPLPWCVLIACSLTLSSCTTYLGPTTQDPEQTLPRSVLMEKVANLQESDAIEIRFTDGASARRQYRSVTNDELLTFEGRGTSRREYSDPIETVSGVQSREFQAIRTVLAAAAVVGAILAIQFIAECWSGCFE